MANMNESALKDALTMFRDLRNILLSQELRAEEAMTKAQSELVAARRVRAYLEIQMSDVQRRLAEIHQGEG